MTQNYPFMPDQKQKIRLERPCDSNQNVDREHDGNLRRTIIYRKTCTVFPEYWQNCASAFPFKGVCVRLIPLLW